MLKECFASALGPRGMLPGEFLKNCAVLFALELKYFLQLVFFVTLPAFPALSLPYFPVYKSNWCISRPLFLGVKSPTY